VKLGINHPSINGKNELQEDAFERIKSDYIKCLQDEGLVNLQMQKHQA